jgi:pimeloyl-ACP methyl ester carboxylesterase
MSSESKTAMLPGGLHLAYVEQGPRAGIPVVLLHGFTDSHHSFDLLRPHLPRSLRVLAPTQRGHGASDKPHGGYAIADFARDAVDFLDAVGIERAILVGHSMGAAVALQAAADHSDRVRGIALIGAFADLRGNPGAIELADACAELTDPVDREFARAFQESTLANPTPDGFLDMAIAESLKVPAFVWRTASRGFLDADLPDAATRATAPALILWGEEDAFCPHADQRALRAALPGAQLHTLPGIGHAVHWERPAETAARLSRFVAAVAHDSNASLMYQGSEAVFSS